LKLIIESKQKPYKLQFSRNLKS